MARGNIVIRDVSDGNSVEIMYSNAAGDTAPGTPATMPDEWQDTSVFTAGFSPAQNFSPATDWVYDDTITSFFILSDRDTNAFNFRTGPESGDPPLTTGWPTDGTVWMRFVTDESDAVVAGWFGLGDEFPDDPAPVDSEVRVTVSDGTNSAVYFITEAHAGIGDEAIQLNLTNESVTGTPVNGTSYSVDIRRRDILTGDPARWIAQRVGEGEWQISRFGVGDDGPMGDDGPAGAVAPRSISIPVYYERSTSPQSTAPGGDINATYNFDTDAFTNLATTAGLNRWQTIAPTADLDGTNVYWQGTMTFTETITNNARSGVSPSTDVDNISRGFLFDGVVRFTNSNTISDGTSSQAFGNLAAVDSIGLDLVNDSGALAGQNSVNLPNQATGLLPDNLLSSENVTTQGNSGSLFSNETVIDGGQINTGLISTQYLLVDSALALSGPNAGFIAGRTSLSDFGTDGFYIGRSSTTGNVADGFQLSHTSVTGSDSVGDASNLLNSGTVQGVIHDDTAGLRIYEPIFYTRGLAGAGSNTILTGDGNLSLSAGDIHTITLIGGGGGGGGGSQAQTTTGTTSTNSNFGNAGGATNASLSGYSGGSYNGPNNFSAGGGAGGAPGLTATSSGPAGGAGAPSPFGPGGVGGNAVGNSGANAGGDAPDASYGAAGAGGGGPSRDFGFNNNENAQFTSGLGGVGGSAGSETTFTIDLTNSNNNANLSVNVGTGGNGGNGAGGGNGGAGRQGTASISDVLDGYVPLTLNNLGPALPGWLTTANPNITFSISNNSNNNSTVHINSNNNDRWIRGQQNSSIENPIRLEWVNSGNGWMYWSGATNITATGGVSANANRVEQVAGAILRANTTDESNNSENVQGFFEAFVPAGASIRGGIRTNTSVQVWEA